jgi:hypothetical protein
MGSIMDRRVTAPLRLADADGGNWQLARPFRDRGSMTDFVIYLLGVSAYGSELGDADSSP